MKPKIIVILGPTASGKSDLAVVLAKKFDGEVISADSRQVYKGLDIGTGKITKKEMKGVPHHLLDVASPRRVFNASDFKDLAEKAIQKILKNKKVPIVCGGTGFYIDALFGDKQIPEVPPNLELRKELEQKTIGELFEILQKLDPERAENIDAKNPRRLVRAIEICEALGRVPPLRQDSAEQAKYEVLKIGVAPLKEITHSLSAMLGPSLTTREGSESPLLSEGGLGVGFFVDETELKERINKRIERWFEEGILAEVKNLHKKGLTWKRMSEIGLEYKLVAEYLMSRSNLDTNKLKNLKKKMAEKTWQYAKRQMTWFKKSKDVIWFDPRNIIEIEKEVKKFLNR